MLLLIDNYDSFTWNLAQYFGELGARPIVRRNDEISVDDVVAMIGQGLARRRPPIFELDDVVPELGLYRRGDLPDRESRDRLIELGHHLALRKPAELAPRALGPFVLGKLFRRLRKLDVLVVDRAQDLAGLLLAAH